MVTPEHDTVLLKRSLEREGPRRVRRVVGDRGFDSKATREWLAARKVVNAIAPKDPGLLRMRLHEATFRQLQQRRGQTEARIAIFKNAFLGAPLLAKGHQNQARLVAWNVLTHDLWLLAGLEAGGQESGKIESRLSLQEDKPGNLIVSRRCRVTRSVACNVNKGGQIGESSHAEPLVSPARPLQVPQAARQCAIWVTKSPEYRTGSR